MWVWSVTILRSEGVSSPAGSPFGAANTAEDVIEGIDLTGKTAIVTGGYSGIGREAVRVLLAAGATVVVPTRNMAKARESLAEVDGVVLDTMDLMEWAATSPLLEGRGGVYLGNNEVCTELTEDEGNSTTTASRAARRTR